tara:strand:- start:47 stop:448 length:402 start_codon:yes stop_codon:yes gene_type:complete
MNNINPLGKTYKEYQEEVKKVNLKKSYKIELGLAQDLEKASKKSDSLIKKSKKLVDKMEKLFKSYNDQNQKLITEGDELKQQLSRNERLIIDSKSAAKELGVDIKDIKGISALEEVNGSLGIEIYKLNFPKIG